MIQRHKISRNISEEIISAKLKLEKFRQKVSDKLRNDSNVNLRAYSQMCLRVPIYNLVLKSDDNLVQDLYRHLESGIAHYRRTLTTTERVSIKIDNEAFLIASSKKVENISIYEWWKLFNVAIILNDKKYQDELILFRDKVIQYDKSPFWTRFTDLTLMMFGYKEFESSILDDLNGIVNSGITTFYGLKETKLIKLNESIKMRKIFWLPIAEILFHSHNSDVRIVNEVIEKYLLSKKDWIVTNKENDDLRYWIDFPLIAACIKAKKNGISIEIESEYMPDIYIENN